MSKRKFKKGLTTPNKKVAVGSNFNLQLNKLVKLSTANIAFKLTSEVMSSVLLKKSSYGIPNNYHLLGVNFEFKRRMSDGSPLDYINIHHVYYKYDVSLPPEQQIDYYIYPPLDDASTPPVLTLNKHNNENKNVETFEINQFENIGIIQAGGNIQSELIYHDLAPVPKTSQEAIIDHGKLDFFGAVDFVYFSVDQIRPLVHLFQNIIISGSQIDFGKKLGHLPNRDPEKFNKLFFTLKMEGVDPSQEYAYSFLKGNGIEIDQGVGMITGQPCPPNWYPFYTMVLNLHKRIQIDYSLKKEEVVKLYNALFSSWDNWNRKVK